MTSYYVRKYPIAKKTDLKRLLHILIDIDYDYYIGEKGVPAEVYSYIRNLIIGLMSRFPRLDDSRIKILNNLREGFQDIKGLDEAIEAVRNGVAN